MFVRLYVRHTADCFMQLSAAAGETCQEQQRHALHAMCGGAFELGTELFVNRCRELGVTAKTEGRALNAAEVASLQDMMLEMHADLARWLGQNEPGSQPQANVAA
jgi:hypothetical protein